MRYSWKHQGQTQILKYFKKVAKNGNHKVTEKAPALTSSEKKTARSDAAIISQVVASTIAGERPTSHEIDRIQFMLKKFIECDEFPDFNDYEEMEEIQQ